MTRKHFMALAEALHAAHPMFAPNINDEECVAALAVWTRCVGAVADACEKFNVDFDRTRFGRAARGET